MQMNQMSDLTGNTNTTYTAVYVGSYYCPSGTPCPADGGQGLFVRSTSTTCAADGGRVVVDSEPTPQCWYRQNLNGDLRQWGITAGSKYDASRFTPISHLVASDGLVGAAITALTTAGISTIHTGQVSILLESRLSLPSGWSFTCDTPPVKDATNADYTHIPGSIILGHGSTVYLDATASNVEIHDCAMILPEWYINPDKVSTFQGYPFTAAGHAHFAYADLEAIRSNMILASDAAIMAGTGANIHDVTIAGFDNCLEATGGARLVATNIMMDCAIGFYGFNNGGGTDLHIVGNLPLLTRQPGFANEEYWDISSITGSSTDECELQLKPNSTASFPLTDIQNSNSGAATAPSGLRGDPYSYPAWVTNLTTAGLPCSSVGTGAFGNDAAWTVHNLNTAHIGDPDPYVTVDLAGSHWAPHDHMSGGGSDVVTHGDWNANSNIIHVAGPVSNLTPGMLLNSSDPHWPSSDPSIVSVNQRCTGPDPNDGYNGCIVISTTLPYQSTNTPNINAYDPQDFAPATNKCDGQGKGFCFYYNAAERYLSGNSDAGKASARVPASRGGHMGAGFLMYEISGLRGTALDTYGHYYNYASLDSASCVVNQVAGDDNGELDAANSVGISVAGSSRGCQFIAKDTGKSGTAMAADTYGTLDQVEQQVNDADLTGLRNLLQYQVSNGSNYLPVPHVENFAKRGVLHICLTYDPHNSAICNTGDFNEFVDETVVSGTTGPGTLSINVRGRFGTAPVNWHDTCPSGSCAQLYIFPTTINGGSVAGGRPTASTLFSAMNDNSTVGSQSQFEVQHGAATFQNLRSEGRGMGFISTNASGAIIASSNIPNTALTFEDTHARILTTVSPDSTLANSPEQGALNLPLSYYQWFGSPQGINVSGSGVSASQLGNVTVQDTTNWPPTGILSIDSEYASFHIVDGVTLSLDQRGLCGSLPVAHNAGSMASYQYVLYGCPSSGQGLSQFAMDATGEIASQQSGLAHGQVYMSFDGSNIELCPRNGSGLMIAGALRQLRGCSFLPETGAASGLQYVYATYHQIPVTAIDNASSHLRLAVPTTAGYAPNSALTCYGITGTGASQINGITQTSTSYVTDTYISLLGTTSVSPPPHGTGACEYISMEFSTTAYTLDSKGVEVMSGAGNSSKTLVGEVYAASAGTILDNATHRDVASWFNRKGKACIATWSANGRATSSSYTELKTTTAPINPLHCEFVAWNQDDVSWSLFGMVNDSTSNEVASLAAAFDGTSPTTEIVQWQESDPSQRYPLGLSGQTSFSADNVHYITTLGKSPTSASVTVYASGGEEVRIPQ